MNPNPALFLQVSPVFSDRHPKSLFVHQVLSGSLRRLVHCQFKNEIGRLEPFAHQHVFWLVAVSGRLLQITSHFLGLHAKEVGRFCDLSTAVKRHILTHCQCHHCKHECHPWPPKSLSILCHLSFYGGADVVSLFLPLAEFQPFREHGNKNAISSRHRCRRRLCLQA
jgi:hypothetical protein